MSVLYESPSEPKPVKKLKVSKVADLVPQGGKLSAFLIRPTKVHFQSQEQGEEIILLLRRHWVTNIRWILTAAAMMMVPLAFYNFPIIAFLPARFQTMVIIIWYLLVIAFVFEQFLSWYFNVYIVTNKRVVDLDFYNIIYYNQAQADLKEITDMNVTVSGVLRLLFNYGELVIETAAEAPNLEFGCVPDPRRVMQIIEKLKP